MTRSGKFGRYPLLLGTVAAFAVSIMVALITLMIERSQNLDQRRELVFWSAAQTNLEYWRFVDAFDRFTLGSKVINRDGVLLRMDILWSRINLYESGYVAERMKTVKGVKETILGLAKTLEAIEPVIQTIKPGDTRLRRQTRQKIAAHGVKLHHAVQRINLAEQASYVQFYWRTIRSDWVLTVLMIGVLASGAVLIFMLLAESRKSTRLLASAVDSRRSAQRKELHLQEVVDTVRDAIITVDASGNISSFNAAAEKMFGRRQRLVSGQSMGILLDERSWRVCERIRQKAGHDSMTPALELTGRRGDGDTFPVELSMGEMLSEMGASFVAVFRDITERKRAEEELLHAQKIDTLGKLTGEVAHEFNNLLTAIGGFAQMAMLHGKDRGRVEQYLGEVIKASDVAANLTNQMLSFGRKQELKPKVVSVAKVLNDLQMMLQPMISTSITLQLNVGNDDAHIYTDPIQLSQAVLNLAINATHAMPDGGRLIIGTRVVTGKKRRSAIPGTTGPSDKFVTIYVSDTGTGMDDGTLEHIFEPFFSTKPDGAGTGLGLSMVHGMVEQSGGWIDVDTEIGRGSTFAINLPLAVPDGQDLLEDVAEEQSEEAKDAAAGTTVLVAEDQLQVRELARIALEERGYNVLTAENGAEALKIYRDFGGNLALLLSDVAMPEMNGPALVSELRKDKPRLKVIFMSGHVRMGDMDPGDLGSDTWFIKKPFDPRELTRMVEEGLSADDSED